MERSTKGNTNSTKHFFKLKTSMEKPIPDLKIFQNGAHGKPLDLKFDVIKGSTLTLNLLRELRLNNCKGKKTSQVVL